METNNNPNPKELYKSASNYEDLIKLNIDFIEGRINWTPYHQQPYIPGPLQDQLVKTNRLKFLTLGGQCAEDTPTEEKKLFLDGYLHPDLVRNFVKYLKRFPKIEYYIEFLSTKQIKTNIRNWHNHYNFQENQSVYFNSLSRVKQGNEWKNKDILPFRDLSYITLKYWNGFPNILKILQNYAFVHIQHRSFHNLKNDLYTIINGYLQSDQSSYKPKKKKENHFGKSLKKLKSLKELYSDLSKVERCSSFGVKTKKQTKKEQKAQSVFARANNHVKEHKWKYATLLANAIALTAVKNRVNKVLNRSHEKKKALKQELRLRNILQEELHNYHNTNK